MAEKDYYAILGVAKTASDEELKKAFRKLAMQHHPDRNQGNKAAEQKFKEVNEAYEVLKDPQKRGAYDRFGSSAFSGGAGGGQGGFGSGGFGSGGFQGNASYEDISDIFNGFFNDFMGGGGKQRQDSETMNTGSDLRYDLSIALEDAYNGVKKNIQYKTYVECNKCDGYGSQSKSKDSFTNCGTCKGSGRTRMQQGFFMVEKYCSSCNGSGKIIKDPCKPCNGEGRVYGEKNIAVTIPSGIENGAKIRLSNEGEKGIRKGKAGDIYIFVTIKPHKFFERHGSNLHCTIPVKMTTAALGGTIEVPTLSGNLEKMTINPGTQHGAQVPLRNKGMPILKSNRHGDLIVHLNVETPVKLTKKQQELLQEFDKECTADTNPQSAGFFSKIKSIWEGIM